MENGSPLQGPVQTEDKPIVPKENHVSRQSDLWALPSGAAICGKKERHLWMGRVVMRLWRSPANRWGACSLCFPAGRARAPPNASI